MKYKNLIIVPENLIFNEKISLRNAVKKMYKDMNKEFTKTETDLFTALYTKYENDNRINQLNILLSALFSELPLEDAQQKLLTYLSSQHRLQKNSEATLNQLLNKTQVYLISTFPQKIISNRLQAANIDPALLINQNSDFQTMNNALEEVFHNPEINKDDTLVIGSNLSDEIQASQDLKVNSAWVNNKRKVPITPHPEIHLKHFSDILFYFMN